MSEDLERSKDAATENAADDAIDRHGETSEGEEDDFEGHRHVAQTERHGQHVDRPTE